MIIEQDLDTTTNPIMELERTLNPILTYLGYAAFAIGAIILIYHIIKLNTFKDSKKKYDYINASEINNIWYTIMMCLTGTAFIVFTLDAFAASQPVWMAVKVLVVIAFGILIGVIFYYPLQFYYPSLLETRLRKIRYKPRISPKTGNTMKLLSEDEEDVYLDEGMQAEENVRSVDYDVWIDEETGFTMIEKYQGSLIANRCPECNYQTLKVVREEIITSPEVNQEGELDKFLKCIYCGHKQRKTFKIAALKESSAEA